MSRLSVITPTCDRPVAFGLLEGFMRAQTRQPDEWIVADGGIVPADVTLGQRVVRSPRPPGASNFLHNLEGALAVATGDVILFLEDDDHYQPTHLERLMGQLADEDALIAGDDVQRYYNVRQRCWRVFQNRGASLCQTGLKRALLPLLSRVIAACQRRHAFSVDAELWELVPAPAQRLARTETVVGIKGLPGRAGLGIGHRPSGPEWHPDPTLATLRSWIGDCSMYERLAWRS